MSSWRFLRGPNGPTRMMRNLVVVSDGALHELRRASSELVDSIIEAADRGDEEGVAGILSDVDPKARREFPANELLAVRFGEELGHLELDMGGSRRPVVLMSNATDSAEVAEFGRDMAGRLFPHVLPMAARPVSTYARNALLRHLLCAAVLMWAALNADGARSTRRSSRRRGSDSFEELMAFLPSWLIVVLGLAIVGWLVFRFLRRTVLASDVVEYRIASAVIA